MNVRLWTVALLMAALLVAPAVGAERATVAVLYFDNNSPHREYDVLQKGLADMLVTDLSQIDTLQVVERDKLQKLVDELALQRSKFFDPKTAQRLGQGIGARYAITGAIATLDPQLRIDVRLIEVATARVVLADKVVGHRDKLFDLEAALVAKLAKALSARLPGSASRSGAGNLSTLLQYSQGIDAADKGDLQDASRRLAEVVRNAPDFQLAKSRYTDVLLRLREAGKRREGALSNAETELVAHIDARLAAGPGKATDRYRLQDAWERYLGYRVARGNHLLGKLSPLVAPHQSPRGVSVVPADKRAELLRLGRAYFDNTAALVTELRTAREVLGRDPSPRMEAADRQLAKAAGRDGLDQWTFVSHVKASMGLVQFVVHGQTPYAVPVKLAFRPSLGDLDPSYRTRALALLADAEKDLKRDGVRQQESKDIIDVVDAHAEALVALGRKEEAIARWQWVLETYPTSEEYKELEKKIEELLGVSPEANQFKEAVKTCSDELSKLMPWAMPRARRADGMRGVRKQIDQVAIACKGNERAPVAMASAWASATEEAIAVGDCAFYRTIRAEAAKMGDRWLKIVATTAGNACSPP